MRHIKTLSFLLLFASCSNNSTQKNSPTDSMGWEQDAPVYMDGSITITKRYKHDAVLIPYCIGNIYTGSLRSGYNFEFFTYGNELRLSNSIRENIFVKDVARVQKYEILQKEDIHNAIQKSSSSYGDYGTCSIISATKRKIIEDVLITPIAWNYLNSVNSDESLLLVNYEYPEDNKGRSIIYLTDYIADFILRKSPGTILQDIDMCFKADENWPTVSSAVVPWQKENVVIAE